MVDTTDVNDDELRLVRAYQQGDVAAFDSLFRRYHPRIRALCARYVGGGQLADDLVQETFYRVVKTIARIDDGFNFGAWVARIAINLCISEQRRTMRRGGEHSSVDTEEVTGGLASCDRTALPEDALEATELRRVIWEVAAKLPERQRMVLALRELQGLPYSAIARVMGISESAVETLLHRARRGFQSHYLRLDAPPVSRDTSCPPVPASSAKNGRAGVAAAGSRAARPVHAGG